MEVEEPPILSSHRDGSEGNESVPREEPAVTEPISGDPIAGTSGGVISSVEESVSGATGPNKKKKKKQRPI
jgi:hypothetical protein